MSAKSLLVHVKFGPGALELIDKEVALANQKNRHRPHTRSSWVREAIALVVAWNEASRRRKRDKGIRCHMCKKRLTKAQIAFKQDLLTGGTDYFCVNCNPV